LLRNIKVPVTGEGGLMHFLDIILGIGGVTMARAPRVIFEGAVYHVYQMGNNKDYIF
jgi:uncharacterized membrane protein